MFHGNVSKYNFLKEYAKGHSLHVIILLSQNYTRAVYLQPLPMLEMSRKNFEFSVHQANETTIEVVARHWASQGYYINVGTCRFHFFIYTPGPWLVRFFRSVKNPHEPNPKYLSH